MKRTIIFFLSIILLSSCKETVKTPGQITADEISAVAKQHSITNVAIGDPATGFVAGPVPFTLSGQYLITNGVFYYNLDSLSYFEVSSITPPGGQSTPVLVLFFK